LTLSAPQRYQLAKMKPPIRLKGGMLIVPKHDISELMLRNKNFPQKNFVYTWKNDDLPATV